CCIRITQLQAVWFSDRITQQSLTNYYHPNKIDYIFVQKKLKSLVNIKTYYVLSIINFYKL
ncbi:hypothetical protein CGJ13_23325, partial [Vibrio parahaemolyticus]